jgi:hypothetical protein
MNGRINYVNRDNNMKQLRFFFILMAWVCIHTAWGQVSTSSDPLYGKRIGVIGDSYVRNHREPVEYTWHYKFAKKHGMQYFNYGRNGNCVAMPRARFGEAMYKRYKEMTDSLDYVVVIAGHNDASLLDSIGIDNYKEKLGILCEGLIEKYPSASCQVPSKEIFAGVSLTRGIFPASVICIPFTSIGDSFAAKLSLSISSIDFCAITIGVDSSKVIIVMIRVLMDSIYSDYCCVLLYFRSVLNCGRSCV